MRPPIDMEGGSVARAFWLGGWTAAPIRSRGRHPEAAMAVRRWRRAGKDLKCKNSSLSRVRFGGPSKSEAGAGEREALVTAARVARRFCARRCDVSLRWRKRTAASPLLPIVGRNVEEEEEGESKERARRRGYRPKERGEKGQAGKRGRMSDKVWMCRQNAGWMCRASQDTRALF